jgi:transcriptional regulator with XRE-family HTH domain
MSSQPDNSGGFIPRVESFGDRLALLRHRLGLSRKAAAAKCDLDDASWANWERANTRPRDFPEVVQAISDNLGADRDWLMWGHDGGGGPPRANLPREGRLLSSRAA